MEQIDWGLVAGRSGSCSLVVLAAAVRDARLLGQYQRSL
jgi:hypothetical protein